MRVLWRKPKPPEIICFTPSWLRLGKIRVEFYYEKHSLRLMELNSYERNGDRPRSAQLRGWYFNDLRESGVLFLSTTHRLGDKAIRGLRRQSHHV